MPQRSNFFKSIAGDRTYSASDYSERFKSFLTNGVFVDNTLEIGTELKVTTDESNLILDIDLGKAILRGYFYEVYASPVSVTLDTADPALPRIDRVILRLDTGDATRSIIVTKLTGTPSSNPVAPDLTTSGNITEISLAQVAIAAGAVAITSGNITDEREKSQLLSGGFAKVNGDALEDFISKNLYLGGFQEIEETTEPSIPSTTKKRLFVDDDGSYVFIDSDGYKSIIAPKRQNVYSTYSSAYIFTGGRFEIDNIYYGNIPTSKVSSPSSNLIKLKAGYTYEIIAQLTYIKESTSNERYVNYKIGLAAGTTRSTFLSTDGLAGQPSTTQYGSASSRTLLTAVTDVMIEVRHEGGDDVDECVCNVIVNMV